MFSVNQLPTKHSFCSNTYIIESADECAVVDPCAPYSTAYGNVKYVLLTHAHFDHMLDIDSWASHGAQVIVSRYDKASLSDPIKNCSLAFLANGIVYHGNVHSVDGGDVIPLGDETIRITSAPGHTPGSLVYTIGNIAFVGDLAFAGGGYGRCDLPGGDEDSLRHSIDNLLRWDDSTVLLPGHGYSTTVGEYRKQYRNF